MERVDRRTFLANSLRTGAVVAAAGTIAYEEWSVVHQSEATAPSTFGQPVSVGANGEDPAIGVDADDLSFSWEVTDSRAGALQSAYRVIVNRSGSSARATSTRSASPVWDSGEVVSRQQSFVRYGGPELAAATAYEVTVQTRDNQGVWGTRSQPSRFITGLRKSDWTSTWLHPGPASPGLEEYTYLRKLADLPAGNVAHAVFYVAAAHKYQLWCNGVKLDTGPSFCYPDEQYVQATEVTEALQPGKQNTLGFLHHWYSAGKGRPTSVPGLLAQLVVTYSDGRRFIIGTDGTWKQRTAEWLPAPERNTDGGDFIEIIDARLHPKDWSTPAYDDSGWEPVTEIGPVGTAPFTELFVLRTRITEFPVKPVSVTTLDDGAVVVDFGKIYAARPIVELDQGVEGRVIPMHVGYVLDPDGHVSTVHATQATNLAFYYTERDGSQTFDPYTFLGWRYLEIDAPQEVITSDQVTAMARHCTLPAGEAATFSSSNKMLDDVWDLCSRSATFAVHEQFVDTPTREKGQFLWDACNESQVVMRVYRDHNLSAQALRDFARSQKRFWPDGRVSDIYPTGYGAQSYVNFTALYPEWVWRYYLSTGDLATVTTLYATLKGVCEYLWRPVSSKTGLVTGVPLYPSADSNYGYDFDTECDASINILSANAFARTADIASAVGDQSGAATQRQRAATVANAVNRYLTRPDGIYVDGLRSDGTRSSHASQLANIQALSYGLVPQANARAVGEYVASLGISVEPSDSLELFRALHVAGLDAEVVKILTDDSYPGYAWILTHGGTFCWEAWVLSDVIGDSMSHGWGSSALVAMQEALLGVVPAAPTDGGPPTVLDIAPAFSVLEHASGIVPTFAGTASISWDRTGGGVRVQVDLPPNSAARFRIPASSPSAVKVDGGPIAGTAGVELAGYESGDVILKLGAGSYVFTT